MTSDHPRTGARVSSGAVTPAFPPVPLGTWSPPSRSASIRGDGSVLVTDVAFDSREVSPGALFFCVPGLHADGHAFAAAGGGGRGSGPGRRAVARRGRCRRLSSRRSGARWDPCPPVAFGRPASAMATVGVTGTNGKTTVTYLLASIFRAAGWTPGMVGTTGQPAGDGRRCRSRGPRPRRRTCTGCSRGCVTEGVRAASRWRCRRTRWPSPCRRGRLRRGGLHEPLAGPPRLPRDDGGVLRRPRPGCSRRITRAGRS